MGMCDVDQPEVQLFTASKREAKQRVADSNSQELANPAWAFAMSAGQMCCGSRFGFEAEQRVDYFNA